MDPEEYDEKLKQRFWNLYEGNESLNSAKCETPAQAISSFSFGEVERLAQQFGVQCYHNFERRRKAEIFDDVWAAAAIIFARTQATKSTVAPALLKELPPITVDPRAIFLPKRTAADYHAATADYYNLNYQMSEYFGVTSPPRVEAAEQSASEAQSAIRANGFTVLIGDAPQPLVSSENAETEIISSVQSDAAQVNDQSPVTEESNIVAEVEPVPAAETPAVSEESVQESVDQTPSTASSVSDPAEVAVSSDVAPDSAPDSAPAIEAVVEAVVEAAPEAGQKKGSKKGKKK